MTFFVKLLFDSFDAQTDLVLYTIVLFFTYRRDNVIITIIAFSFSFTQSQNECEYQWIFVYNAYKDFIQMLKNYGT